MPSPLPTPRQSVVWTGLPDGAVLFSTETEVYFSLNQVGAVVWELLSDGRSMDDLCAGVQARFPDADPVDVRRDVDELLGELLRARLLEVPEGA